MKMPHQHRFVGFTAALSICLCVLGSGSTNAQVATYKSQQQADLQVVQPVQDCAKLASASISDAVGSKTHITATTVVSSGPAPYCRVQGYVEPAIKFEVRLPTRSWTQRYVQTGCGGLCGRLDIQNSNTTGCYPAEHGELALASTDMGHEGDMDGKFGAEDYQLRIDFAYRSVHLTALAAKALIAAFYGEGPRFSYFSGCSDGGREALMEAQRFPDDFNGITAGAAAMNFTTQNTFYHGWNAVKNTGSNEEPILTTEQLPVLHRAAIAACDAIDGVKDGLISDPLSCHFDPAVVECKSSQTAACLTHAQVEAARAIYAGANDGKGGKLVLHGPLPGSELAWGGVYIPSPGSNRTMSPMISTGSLKYLVYEKNPTSTYTLSDLQFTRNSFTATTELHDLYDATDPDLSGFAKRGGKLIIWHGLADPHISPLNSIAYYSAVKNLMGNKATQDFARLYLFPGGYHCGGGEGPFDFDLLGSMIAWVEKGRAPFALIASHQTGGPRGPIAGVPGGMPAGGMTPGGPSGFPHQNRPDLGPPPDGPGSGEPPFARAAAAKVDRTRPVFPYPLTSTYKGTGSIDDATNFVAGPANPVPAAELQWLGSSFFTPHYEAWCDASGATMTCKPTH